MIQSKRQSELFTGEDWTVLYRSLSQINFNAYDPASINAALREYIQTNYPEDYNDWIESSEFVAIIDLLSWLAGSLAFRTDLNTRENFLESAQARESVLRLARFLSYNPRRSQSARGLVKITELRTTQSVVDSLGEDLSNTVIKWDDPDNLDWLEQFTAILNAAFPSINPFGIPLKNEVVSGVRTQLYALNTAYNPNCVYKFNTSVDGTIEPFEIVNVDYDNIGFSERTPDPSNLFHILYRNDGRGNASQRTGFFMFFKQGILHQKTWSIETKRENRVIEIAGPNISESDVWVQTLTDTNDIMRTWEKVPAIVSNNITFNDIGESIRDIFSVITKDADTVALRFSDGRFGNVPYGNLRAWYRSVNGKQYQITPKEINNVTVNIPYVDAYGKNQTLFVRFSLMENINNAVGPETIEQVKQRAPQVYATQNRMVSGEDYNTFPLSTNEIIKLRAVNRVYSGHSRYLDMHDPTSNYSETTIFSNDGILYKDPDVRQYTQVPEHVNYTTSQLIIDRIQPMLQSDQVKNYVTDYTLDNSMSFDLVFETESFVWETISNDNTASVGYFKASEGGATICNGVGRPYSASTTKEQEVLKRFINAGAMLQFEWVEDGEKVAKWVSIKKTNVDRSDEICFFNETITKKEDNPLTVDGSLPNGAWLKQIIPAYRGTLDTRQMIERDDLGTSSEMRVLEEFITTKRPFDLWYVVGLNSKIANTITEVPGQWVSQNLDEPSPHPTAIKVLTGRYSEGVYWSFETNVGLRYVFESEKDVVWTAIKEYGAENLDTVSIVWPKYRPNNTTVDEVKFDISNNIYYPDGLHDFRKVEVSPNDSDKDGAVDIPNSFEYVVGPDDYALFSIALNELYEKLTPINAELVNTIPTFYRGELIFLKTTKLFYRWSTDKYVLADQKRYTWRRGISNLRFKWNHRVGLDHRIDSAITNIIDIFVLTTEYDMLTRQWVKDNNPSAEPPAPPSILELKSRFTEFDKYKMVTDQIVWRPVSYKFIFGKKSNPEFRAKIKVVKIPATAMSDGEIKSRVIGHINDFFDVSKWEFGETFYFTELAAYIHYQMATILSSVVLVPDTDGGRFGEMFEMRCDPNQMFLSTAQVEDVVIIDANTYSNLRI